MNRAIQSHCDFHWDVAQRKPNSERKTNGFRMAGSVSASSLLPYGCNFQRQDKRLNDDPTTFLAPSFMHGVKQATSLETKLFRRLLTLGILQNTMQTPGR